MEVLHRRNSLVPIIAAFGSQLESPNAGKTEGLASCVFHNDDHVGNENRRRGSTSVRHFAFADRVASVTWLTFGVLYPKSRKDYLHHPIPFVPNEEIIGAPCFLS